MNRRNFIKNLSDLILATGALQLFPLNWAVGETVDPHFFVLVMANDGLDCTLGLDPQIHNGTDQEDIFIEYREDQIAHANGLRLGPAAAGLLGSHANDILAINGVNMRRDAGHEALSEYMASGHGDGMSALLPVEIAALMGSGTLGITVNEAINQGKRRAVLSSVSELITMTGESKLRNLEKFELIQKVRGGDSSFRQAESGFLNAIDGIKELVDKLKESGVDSGQSQDMQAQQLATALAFSSNLSRQAVLTINEGSLNLDTHSNHVGVHLQSQAVVWSQINDLFSTFKEVPFQGKSLFDYTTFMVTTEFSRTPFLNGAKGKDHNPFTNSVLLAGKNINGGKTVGGSHVISRSKSSQGSALHISTPIDFSTGKLIKSETGVNPDVGLIFPENVAATVATAFGLADKIETIDKTIRPIPGVVKL